MEVTIDLNTIPGESSLVDQGLKDQLAGIFGRMEKKVTIRAVADLSGEKDREMASFLRAIVSVSPNLELELYGPDEADQVPELDTAWLPVTGLYKDGAYGRAAFHGVPGGRKLTPLCWLSITWQGRDRRWRRVPERKSNGWIRRQISRSACPLPAITVLW